MSPEPPGGPELRYLLEDIPEDIEVEGDPGSKFVDVQPPLEDMVDIGHGDLEGIGDLLSRGASGFPYMVPTDAHGIRPGHNLCGVLHGIADEANGWLHGKDPVPPANHLLQDVVLWGGANSVQGKTILFRRGLVHGEDHAGNGVNG